VPLAVWAGLGSQAEQLSAGSVRGVSAGPVSAGLPEMVSAEPLQPDQPARAFSLLPVNFLGLSGDLAAAPGRFAGEQERRYGDFVSVRRHRKKKKSTMLRRKRRNHGLAYGFECLYPTLYWTNERTSR
jgi:hypothetical protein